MRSLTATTLSSIQILVINIQTNMTKTKSINIFISVASQCNTL